MSRYPRISDFKNQSKTEAYYIKIELMKIFGQQLSKMAILYLSPDIILRKVSPTMHLKTGPNTAPSFGCSRDPPTNRSISSTFSYAILNLSIFSAKYST